MINACVKLGPIIFLTPISTYNIYLFEINRVSICNKMLEGGRERKRDGESMFWRSWQARLMRMKWTVDFYINNSNTISLWQIYTRQRCRPVSRFLSRTPISRRKLRMNPRGNYRQIPFATLRLPSIRCIILLLAYPSLLVLRFLIIIRNFIKIWPGPW